MRPVMHLSQRGFGFVTERSTSPRHIEKNICMSITGAWSISVSIPAINVAPTRGGVGSHEVTVCPIMQQYRRTVLPTSLDAGRYDMTDDNGLESAPLRPRPGVRVSVLHWCSV